jgi:hypothetical protein
MGRVPHGAEGREVRSPIALRLRNTSQPHLFTWCAKLSRWRSSAGSSHPIVAEICRSTVEFLAALALSSNFFSLIYRKEGGFAGRRALQRLLYVTM